MKTAYRFRFGCGCSVSRAKTVIEQALTDDYIVALNLVSPFRWMQAIGAGKMNLGLDLRGECTF